MQQGKNSRFMPTSARPMEATDRNTESLKMAHPALHKLEADPSHLQTQPCYRCGRSYHSPNNCKFRNSICHYCKKKGHIAPICRAKQQETSHRITLTVRRKRGSGDRRTKCIAADNQEEEADLPMHSVREPSSKHYFVTMLVDGQQLQMEIDTEAAVSLVVEATKKRLFPAAAMKKADIRMQTYTGQQMKVQGYLNVAVEYSGQTKDLRLFLVDGSGPPSWEGTGSNIIIRLNWATIAKVKVQNPSTIWKNSRQKT